MPSYGELGIGGADADTDVELRDRMYAQLRSPGAVRIERDPDVPGRMIARIDLFEP